MSDQDNMPPMLGFDEERIVSSTSIRRRYESGHPKIYTTFYTCICNDKRVFMWGWLNKKCYIVATGDYFTDVSDGHLQEEFRRCARDIDSLTIHSHYNDWLLIKLAICEVTSGGN